MSRIGKLPISIPAGVTVTLKDNVVNVKGPKGELSQFVNPAINVEIADGHVVLKEDEGAMLDNLKQRHAFHGLYRALIHNMVVGVSEGYKKELELVGVGYRASNNGNIIDFDLVELDNGLRHYAQVIKEYTNMDISQLPGAGAAGGMGGGLLPFLNAELQSGIEVILKTLRFEEVVRQADLILTGEGKLDRQTGMGKALDGILRVGERCQVPVIALGGAVEATEALNRMGFTAVLPIQPFPVTLEEAMRPEFTKENIERTVRQVVRIIKQFTK